MNETIQVVLKNRKAIDCAQLLPQQIPPIYPQHHQID